MVNINPALEQQLKTMPNRTFNLIVRTASPAEPHLEWLNAAGLEVKHVYRLSPGVAIAGSGRAALQLLEQSWVLSIELDAEVTTM
jgi:hypothetical protein